MSSGSGGAGQRVQNGAGEELDENVLRKVGAELQKEQNKAPGPVKDFRRVLDNKDIDCLIAAVPDHWHRQVVVDAVSAGKDIYCEKPMSHTAEDGVAMLDAAKKSGRIVQIGSLPILLPVVIWVWMVRDVGAAVLITIFLVLVGLSDNALKPLLMGRGLSTPVLVIFMGVLGGTLAHGIVGLFVGPIILAVAWELLMAWSRDAPAGVVAADQKTGELKP